MRSALAMIAAGVLAVMAPMAQAHLRRAAATTPRPVLGSGAAASFARLEKSQGDIGIAITPLGGAATIQTLGDTRAAHAWSTSKVPVLVALITARGGVANLTATERSEATTAITVSDNASILALFHDLEGLKGGLKGASAAVTQVLRRSGDSTTTVATGPIPSGAATTFGQTEWPVAASVRFFRALGRGCLMSHPNTSYVLGLMEHIASADAWGFGSAGFRTPVAYKGGWGPEGSASGPYLVRQSAIIDPGSPSGVAVSIIARPANGTFDRGTTMLTAAARWLRQNLVLSSHGSISCG